MTEPKLNNLIPMVDPEGGRCFVNAWDVATRTADGWKVLGDIKRHTSTTQAPLGVLNDGAPSAPAATPADALALERARVRAILGAAGDDQAALADKLIDEGKSEAHALKALAADAAKRNPASKPASKPKAEAATPAAAPPGS